MEKQEFGTAISPERIHLKIGEYVVHSLPTGIFGLDGGAMFGTVPRELWQKTNPPDQYNRIAMEARALLLTSPQRRVLVDCGNGGQFIEKYGDKLGKKFAAMFNIQRENGIQLELNKLGLNPEDITDVVLTHLHFDHCGGGVEIQDGKAIPTFPRATYYVQKANLATAQQPNIRERASYLPINFDTLLKQKVLRIWEGEVTGEIPHLSIMISNGHTQGQQLVKIQDEFHTLVYCGDLIPTSSHIRSAWVMGYDLHPLLIIEEKTKLLQMAAANNWYLFFEHDPVCPLATVMAKDGDFAINKRFII